MHDITIGVREGTDAIIGEIHNKYREYLTKYDQVNKEKELNDFEEDLVNPKSDKLKEKEEKNENI